MEEEEEGKETKETKKEHDTSGTRDTLSELPDTVLFHIMKFMDTRYAVQTCILSKPWKSLWKSLTSLFFFHSGYCFDFRRHANFNKFVSQVLSGRDGSISLLNLRLLAYHPIGSELLNRVMEYAVLHNVQHLTIQIPFNFGNIPVSFDPLIFSCQSLTFLKLLNSSSGPPLELPKSLRLPALKSLHLINVSFTASDNGCAEPFSTCNLLNTLVLRECSLHNDAKILFISNSSLLSLKMDNTLQPTRNNPDISQHKIVLSTPNLSSLTITGYLHSNYQPLSFTCNLSCLEEGTIHSATNLSHPVFIGWLQVFANVKILALSYHTLKLILKDLSNFATMRAQPPCFVRLESIKVKMNPLHVKISDEEVDKVVKYLLQNSPLSRVAVINCHCSFLNYSGVF